MFGVGGALGSCAISHRYELMSGASLFADFMGGKEDQSPHTRYFVTNLDVVHNQVVYRWPSFTLPKRIWGACSLFLWEAPFTSP